MAIFDNIKNVFKTNEKEPVKEVKEAPIVYYNSLGVDYQQKTRYDQFSKTIEVEEPTTSYGDE